MSLNFLVTNDDGYDAPGIEALVAVLQDFGTTTVVAPLVEHSGCGHRVTTHQPLTLKQTGDHWYSLDCTPADCVRVALSHLPVKFDFVVAGINAGGNLGCDVFMSGTVAAAREAALLSVPGIAISQYRSSRGPIDWDRAQRWIKPAIRKCLDEPIAPGEFWNLNLPDPAETLVAGDGNPVGPAIVRCPLDTNPLAFRYEPQGAQLIYRGAYQERRRSPNCDVAVCFDGAISMTRLQLAPH